MEVAAADSRFPASLEPLANLKVEAISAARLLPLGELLLALLDLLLHRNRAPASTNMPLVARRAAAALSAGPQRWAAATAANAAAANACSRLLSGGPSAEDISALQSQFAADPSAAQTTFGSVSRLTDGVATRADMDGHTLEVDEPLELGGSDSGPNPVQLVAAALGTCQEITYKAYGNAMGIQIKSVSAKVEADLDLRGFFGVSSVGEEARPGFSAVRAKVRVESDADAASLALLREAVDAHCPVLDMLRNPVKVGLSVNAINTGGAPDVQELMGWDKGGPPADAIKGIQQIFGADAGKALMRVTSFSHLREGLKTAAMMDYSWVNPMSAALPPHQQHTIMVDEPISLGGTDTGPNPVQIIAAALGSCQEITYKAYGNAMGIPLRSVSADVTGQIDLRGFFAVGEEARPGFHTILAKVELDVAGGMGEDGVAELMQAVDAHCPVLDMLRNPTDVTTSLEH